MNNKLEQYLQEVRRLLLCDPVEKERCITELAADIEVYLESNPVAAMEGFYEAVGTPEQIAEAFMARLDPKALSKKVSGKRTILTALLVVSIAAVIICGANAAVKAYKLYNFYHGYVNEVVEELPSNAEVDIEPVAEY